MGTYTPESKINSNFYNPNKSVPFRIINSGFLLTQDFLNDYQLVMQENVKNQAVDFLKWPGIASAKFFPLYITSYNRSFELLSHQVVGGSPTVHRVIINGGCFYDGIGSRVVRDYATTVDLTMSTDQDALGYAYVCARFKNIAPIDYLDHPLVGIPQASKVITEMEFYLADGVIEVLSSPMRLVYPEYDLLTDYIPGIAIAKISNTVAPDIDCRTALIACKDGIAEEIPGFIDIFPSAID